MTEKELDRILEDLRDDPWLKLVGVLAISLTFAMGAIVAIHISEHIQKSASGYSSTPTLPT